MEKERKSEEGGGGQAGEGGGGDIQRQVLPSGQVTIAIAPFTESGFRFHPNVVVPILFFFGFMLLMLLVTSPVMIIRPVVAA